MRNAVRERALRLLAQREHTRQELSTRLAASAESAELLEALLDELTASGLLADARYAAARFHARSARLGDARLAYELRSKGVSVELISATLANGEDELTRARRVWQRRFGSQPTVAGDTAGRARQIRFLAGRGFSTETIRRLLRTTLEDD